MKIKQAVILAGGRGERLRPITDEIPKPMVLVSGRPFLEHIIEFLKNNGVEEIVLLLGYLPEKITEHFRDGSKFGVKIKYSITPVDDGTGTRIKKAADLLRDKFCLLYCDNYCPISLNKLYQYHSEKNKNATMTIYSNKYGFTKNNIKIEGCAIKKYDRSRIEKDLNGVDIGFFILDKKVLDLMPLENFSFEEVIISHLVQNEDLAGFVTDFPYISIGKMDRLPDAEKYFSERKIIFLDRDGTINVRPKKAQYVKNWGDLKFLPGAVDAIKLLSQNNFEIYIITNQAGVARGEMSNEDLEIIHSKMIQELRNHGGRINGIYSCLHNWDEDCDCRKPKAGLFFRAALEQKINLCKAFFIGDDERDLLAGNEAGVATYLVDQNNNLLNIVKEKILA